MPTQRTLCHCLLYVFETKTIPEDLSAFYN
jgi:hypothetical protein